MANYTFASVSVTAANQSAMQAIVGTGYFFSPFSADGQPPATYYITAGPYDNDVLNQIMESKLFDRVSFGQEPDWFGLLPIQETPVGLE